MRMLHKPYGCLLIAGPTGSGKTTTLYAALQSINEPSRKITTIEDPIEYRMTGLTQVAVNPRVSLTFAAGLRTLLRFDPDVIMVGEVRDAETASIAVRSALTGHLVLSSIHTNDAPSALTRITDMGVEAVRHVLGADRLGGPAAGAQALSGVQEAAGVLAGAAGGRGLPGRRDSRTWSCTSRSAATRAGRPGLSGRLGVFEIMEMDDEMTRLFLTNAPCRGAA